MGSLRKINQLKRQQDIIEKQRLRSTENTLVIFGDSITRQNVVDSNYSARGFAVWLNIFLRQAYKILAVSGNSGFRADQLPALMQDQVFKYNPAVVLIMAGVNGINQGKPAQSEFNALISMYEAAQQRGIRVIGSTITPSATGMDTDAKRAEYFKLNRMLKEYARNNPGVTMLDMGSAYIQPAAVKAVDNHTVDQTHPSSIGAAKMGYIAAQALRSATTPLPTTLTYNNLDTGNLLVNGNMVGTGGTKTTGTGATLSAESVVPDGWILGLYGSGSAGTATKVAKKDHPGEDLLVTITTGVATTNWNLYKETSTGFAVGDTLFGQFEIEFSDDAVIGKQIQVGCAEYAANTVVSPTHYGLFQESASPDLAFTPKGTLIIRTPDFKVQSGTTKIRSTINPSQTAGSCRVIAAELRKV